MDLFMKIIVWVFFIGSGGWVLFLLWRTLVFNLTRHQIETLEDNVRALRQAESCRTKLEGFSPFFINNGKLRKLCPSCHGFGCLFYGKAVNGGLPYYWNICALCRRDGFVESSEREMELWFEAFGKGRLLEPLCQSSSKD